MTTNSTEEPASKEVGSIFRKMFLLVDIVKEKFSSSAINIEQCLADESPKGGAPGDGVNVSSNQSPVPNNEEQPEGFGGLFSMLANQSTIAIGKLGELVPFNQKADDKKKEVDSQYLSIILCCR